MGAVALLISSAIGRKSCAAPRPKMPSSCYAAAVISIVTVAVERDDQTTVHQASEMTTKRRRNMLLLAMLIDSDGKGAALP
ncbi:hypothetical protein ACH5RR_021060 [Cinchona calisaya]|uniref:Secreted protein n=1 Tax=Cinchona calisaya TaxID=153742 RepID=A0ABD2ZI05_9GENT